MVNIYTDASFDKLTGKSSYCIVINNNGEKDWFAYDKDGLRNSYEAETNALMHAYRWAKKNTQEATLHSDCMSAIKHVKAINRHEGTRHFIKVKHVRAHTILDSEVPFDDDSKAQHWCDIIAYSRLCERIGHIGKIR